MRTLISVSCVIVGLLFSAAAQESGTARPNIIHRELVAGMPHGDRQEVRVITASFKPGDKTVFHTHRFRSQSTSWRGLSR
jgi:quercetin dioxygenase-like cupin family protein